MRQLIIIGMLLLQFTSYGQLDSSLVDSVQISSTDTTIVDVDPEQTDTSLQFVSRKEFWLAITTLIVLLIILPLVINLIKSKGLSDDLSVKLILTIIVILSTLFLVTAGYDDKSIAPAFGLFGAVLGYIFGKSESKNS